MTAITQNKRKIILPAIVKYPVETDALSVSSLLLTTALAVSFFILAGATTCFLYHPLRKCLSFLSL